MYDAATAAGDRFFDQHLEGLIAICQCANQHRKVDAGNALYATGLQQFSDQVAGCCAVNIGQHQYAIASIQFSDQFLCLRQQA